jgi:nucleoside-diphosphate-sugar epimerase
MRVLVTGHRGYIGSVLTSVLRHQRFEVFGLDCDLYRGCDFGRMHESIPSFELDLRHVEFADLLAFDAIVHLAALPEGLPEGIAAEFIDEVNVEATIRLAICAKRAQVSRFIFASTCAVYGRCDQRLLTEDDPPQPITRYALTKLTCERELARLADDSFTPVFFRNGTVYGVSPRLRLDLCINDFVGTAVTRSRIAMQTAGRAWRPVVHVEDVARAYAAALKAPRDAVHNRVLNLVDTRENHRVIDLADAVVEEVPHCHRVAADDVLDQRSYRVDGSALAEALPGFHFRWNPPLGIRQLLMAMTAAGLTPGDWRSDRFRRVPRLLSLMERGEPIRSHPARLTASA